MILHLSAIRKSEEEEHPLSKHYGLHVFLLFLKFASHALHAKEMYTTNFFMFI
jgi:hypothetical protein